MSLAGNSAQQAVVIEAGHTQRGMQRVALAALEPAASHAVIGQGVTDGRLDGLSSFAPATLLVGHGLVSVPVNACANVGRHLMINAALAAIDNGGSELDADAL